MGEREEKSREERESVCVYTALLWDFLNCKDSENLPFASRHSTDLSSSILATL